MDIKYHIHIDNATYKKVAELPCVKSICRNERGIKVILSPDYTHGRLVAHTGEYIAQYSSGLWQCYGAESFQRVILKCK